MLAASLVLILVGSAYAMDGEVELPGMDKTSVERLHSGLFAKIRKCPISQLWQTKEDNEWFTGDALGVGLFYTVGGDLIETYVSHTIDKDRSNHDVGEKLFIWIRKVSSKGNWPVERASISAKDGKVFGEYRFYAKEGAGTPAIIAEFVQDEFSRLKKEIDSALEKHCKRK